MPQIGPENLFSIGQDVIGAIYPKLDSNVCRSCTTRIFRQCRGALPNGQARTSSQVSNPPLNAAPSEPHGLHPFSLHPNFQATP